MLSEARLNEVWFSGIWAYLCGRVLFTIHLPKFILTCLWTGAIESFEVACFLKFEVLRQKLGSAGGFAFEL